MQENLWTHMLGPLKMPIQSEAVIKVFESNFDLKTSQMASDWIGMFKGPNMCASGSLTFGFVSSPYTHS